MSSSLLLDRTDGILTLTMNRPEARNAINRELSLAIADALTELDESPGLFAGIITGAAGNFSAGMDLKAFGAGESIEVEGRGVAGLTRTPPRKPLVAAVEGFALAGAFEMALSCDLIVAAEDVRFGLPEVSRGLIAGSGGLIRLAQRLPYAIAAEYGLTGRHLPAAEAARWGLVNRIVPNGTALDEARAFAGQIGTNSPSATVASKAVLLAASALNDAEAWAIQDASLAEIFESTDAHEGALAFVEKRPPQWNRS